MTEYLAYKRVNGKWTWVCTMTGGSCPAVPVKATPKKLGEMGWEGCACACDRPIEKAMEDRAERYCINEYPDPY